MRAPILIIEDDVTLQSLLRDWLEAIFPHHPVIVAPDSLGAVALVEESAPGVILVGLDAPQVDGVELIRRARRAAPGAEIAALTLDDHTALRDAVRAAGAVCVRLWDVSDRLLPLLRGWLEPGSDREGPITVVCIEDEPEMIRLLELILRRDRYRVFSAMSGPQGLDLVRALRPDVVLLDLMLPGMDGWEVCRRMRADAALRHIPIIAVSVVQPGRAARRGLEVDDYVMKPFAPDELVERVHQAARVAA